MRSSVGMLAILLLCTASAWAQAAPPAQVPPTPAAAPTDDGGERGWSFFGAVYTYLLPEDEDYLQPTIAADRDWLHLEARYNYEGHETGSVWAGYNFAGGETLAWEVTPMVGGVFGDTRGIAPGYKLSLGWRKLALYSEGEYVFDAGDSADSFFFNWSELTLAPLAWLRAGLVTQRTRVYASDRDIQRGVLVGLTYKRLEVVTYVLNPDLDKPTVVLAVVLSS